MTVASDWVTAGAAWRASLTPLGAESVGDQERQSRVFNHSGMTPAAAARAYNRVLAQRELTAQAVHAKSSVAKFGNDQGPSSEFPGSSVQVADPIAEEPKIDYGGHNYAGGKPPEKPIPPNQSNQVPAPPPVTAPPHPTQPNPPQTPELQNPAALDPSRVEAILPEDVKAPERGGPAVQWLENNGTQGSLRIDEFGQRYWRFVQPNGVVIDVTQGGGSDGKDRPWTHTIITEPGQSTPRVDTYGTTGVTVNVDTAASSEIRDLRFQGGDVGVEEHLGGSDGADRPWVQTTQFKPSIESDLPPTRVFTSTRREGSSDQNLVSESAWQDPTGAKYTRLEEWAKDRRTDTITEVDPVTGKPLIYTSIQRLSDRTPILDTRIDVNGITHVLDHTSVDRWGKSVEYHIRPDGSMWDKDGNRIGIADGKLVRFDAAGNYLASGTDGVSVRDADTDNPIRSNGYNHWAFWLTTDEKEVIEPLNRVYAPDGGPAKAYFRTPDGVLIVQDKNGFHQVNNAPSLAELSLNIGVITLAEGVMAGGAGALARASTRLPLGRPLLGRRPAASEVHPPRSSSWGSSEDGATEAASGRASTKAEISPTHTLPNEAGIPPRAGDAPQKPSGIGGETHIDTKAEVVLHPAATRKVPPKTDVADSSGSNQPPVTMSSSGAGSGPVAPPPAGPSSALPPDDLAVYEAFQRYDALGAQPPRMNLARNDAAHASDGAHTVERHGSDVPLWRSDAAVGDRTIQGRLYGDAPWPNVSNWSYRWRDTSTMNRTVNDYIQANWDAIRYDLAFGRPHKAKFDAGRSVGEGFFNRNMGGISNVVDPRYHQTSYVVIVIKSTSGNPPSMMVVTAYPSGAGIG